MSEPKRPLLTDEEKEEFGGYDFHFENIVFEGGGCKGLAYVGVVRVFEELGLWPNFKRFSGSGVGSVAASLLVIGLNSHEIQEIFDTDLSEIIYDARIGIIEKMSNIYRKLGAHSGKKILEWVGASLKKICGDPDITFRQLYKKYGRELCVTAVSLNQMDSQYFHVKTTPDMPIRLAVRASTSVPGLMVPVKYKVTSNDEDMFVDGALLSKYPIYTYDGWYLSMDKKDSFLFRVSDDFGKENAANRESRFENPNKNTVGAILYGSTDPGLFKKSMEDRRAKYSKAEDYSSMPDTKLSRKRLGQAKERERLSSSESLAAIKRLLRQLKKSDKDRSGTISKAEFRVSMSSISGRPNSFTSDDCETLFGSEFRDPDKLFDKLDINKNGEIEFSELISFAERKGLDVMESCRGYERRENFDDLSGMLKALFNTLVLNASRVSVKKSDVDRTIGINTHYLHGFDFSLSGEDRDFMIKCGKQGVMCFLRSYIASNNLQKKTTCPETRPITTGLIGDAK